jgi:hypothetical protein
MKHTFFSVLLFFCLNRVVSQPATLEYNSTSGQFTLSNLRPPKATGIQEYQNKPGYWGIYFFDFGDGSYQLLERPKHNDPVPAMPVHRYAGTGPYKAVVYLTPFYSFDKPLVLERTITAPAKGKPDSETDMDGRLVNLVTSTDNRIIPGHDARVAVHYEAPADGAGTLLLFYGKNTGIKTKVGEPVTFKNEGLHYQEAKYTGVENQRLQAITGSAQAAIAGLRTGALRYPHVAIYDIPAMKKGEQRRLFFTMHANQKLENSRTANINLYVAAMWVPAGAPFKRATMLREMKFSLPPVHDPNNIIGPRRMYYRKGQPKTIDYEVNFQNVAKGTVRDVTVTLPSRGLNFQSMRINPELMEPPCKKCPETNYRDSVCYRLNTTPDTMVLTLYNIGLQPKKGLFNRRYSKGSFGFSVDSDGRFRPRSKVNAKITFLGAETIVTSPAVTQWRHRGLYLEPGYNFGLNRRRVPAALDTGTNALPLNIAIGYQNAPLGRGLLWGAELGLTRQYFFQDTTLSIDSNFGNRLYQSEVFDIWYLDAKVTAGYQLNPFVRFVGGLGTAVPMLAKLRSRAVISTTGDGALISYVSSNEIQYGLLQNRDEKVFIFNQPLENRPSPGISAQWGFEIGAMNTATVGFEHQLRFFPNFYKKGCATLSNLNVYARIKIVPLVSKSN